jgi:tetratricopeptide (TPR) repeat protein
MPVCRALTPAFLFSIVSIFAGSCGRSASNPANLPEVDLSRAHPLVVKAIETGRVEAIDQPESGDAWGRLGLVYLAHDYPEAARASFDQAKTLDPANFRWPYFLGYSLEQTDYGAALSAYESALALRPRYLPLLLRIASIQLRLGSFSDCEATLLRAKQLEPRNPNLLMLLGQLELARNNVDAGKAYFQEAIKQTKWMPGPAYRELAKIAQRRGEIEELRHWQQEVSRYPETARIELPDTVLQQDLRRHEGLGKSLAEQADLALARGDLEAAVAKYREFVQQRPDIPTARVNLGNAHRFLGEFESAESVYTDVLDRFGPNVPALFGLAAVYEQTSRVPLAMETYRRILEIKPDDEQAWFLLGMQQEASGDLEKALRSYQSAIALDPRFPQARLALGIALLKQGNTLEARQHLEEAASLVPGDPVPLRYLEQARGSSKKNAASGRIQTPPAVEQN